MDIARRSLLAAPFVMSAAARAASSGPIRFGVGPLQPTPGDTRRVYEPLFAYLAGQLGRSFELTATIDFAAISIALANDQVDCAWMGPWGYVLAKDHAGAEALGTVKYRGKPTYQAIIIARPELPIVNFPEDAQGLSISFADAGSTSGWLIPHYWFKTHGIDPRTYFKYRDGATHAANDIAVANGQVDLATDYDRNLDAVIAAGRIKADQVKVVWQSDPLPNDALAARRGLEPETKAAIRTALAGMDEATVARVMPPNYTGWISSDATTYAQIEAAGLAMGKIGKGAS